MVLEQPTPRSAMMAIAPVTGANTLSMAALPFQRSDMAWCTAMSSRLVAMAFPMTLLSELAHENFRAHRLAPVAEVAPRLPAWYQASLQPSLRLAGLTAGRRASSSPFRYGQKIGTCLFTSSYTRDIAHPPACLLPLNHPYSASVHEEESEGEER